MPALARRMPAKVFLDWEAYHEIEPFDELRADYRAASIVQMLHNVNVKAKDQRPIGDFLLKFGVEEGPRRKQTVEEQLQILKIIAMTGGARSD